MNRKNGLIPFAAIALLLITVSPAAYASTLKVTINPTTKVADLTSTSVTNLVLTYPSNSTLSHYLRNYSSTVTWTGNFNGSSEGTTVLQGSLEAEDQDVRVQSMNVSYTLKATGNDTALVVNKETDISAVVQGVFRVENGTVIADLDWKAFRVSGEWTLNLEDHAVEVNYVGSSMDTEASDHPFVSAAIVGMFSGDSLWHRATLDFSALNSPLSTWTRNYDSISNTTTYSKTINTVSSFNASADYNGQKYTLSMKSDPSAQVAVSGYAVATGDTVAIQQTPLLLTPTVWVAAGVMALVGVGVVVYFLRRPRAVKAPGTPTSSGSVQ